MKIPLLIAAALITLTGCAHSYLGERFILIRLFRRNDLPRLFGSDLFTRRTLRFAWHITSIAWFGFAALLVFLSSDQATPLVISRILAVTSLASALVAAVGSRGKHASWVVFLVIAALTWFGL